jgi:hypothetical protein
MLVPRSLALKGCLLYFLTHCFHSYVTLILPAPAQEGEDTDAMRLLRNILPGGIIRRLQAGDKFIADSHQHVVVLFSGEINICRMASLLERHSVSCNY